MNDFHVESVTFPQGQDTYLVFAPIPGQAYAAKAVVNNVILGKNDILQSVPFTDTQTLFPSLVQAIDLADNTAMVDKFRFVALSAEIECTSNDMTWTGNIELIKAPISLGMQHAGGNEDLATVITGADSIRGLSLGSGNGNDGYVHADSFKKGFYSTSLNKDPSWGFLDIRDGAVYTDEISCPISTQTAGFPPTQDVLIYRGAVVGIGNMDTIIVRVSIPAGPADMSALLKVWHTVEYRPTYGTILSVVSTPSPSRDLCALSIYEVLYKNLPLAVPQSENANFWTRILDLIKRTAGALTVLPGAAGTIANGVLAGVSLIPTEEA
jgi:hypothetical protein